MIKRKRTCVCFVKVFKFQENKSKIVLGNNNNSNNNNNNNKKGLSQPSQ